MRRALAACAAVAAAAGASALAGGTPAATAGSTTTLTLWHDGSLVGTGFGYVNGIISAFEHAHPGVKIDVVQKPQDNYFALLQAALLSNNGPDIADVYAGSYLTRLEPYLLNLDTDIPASVRNGVAGVQYYTANGSTYALPSEDQFYNMWYNKALFAKAGIAHVPTDFSQMLSDCQTFKSKGITALAEGSPSFLTPGGGAVFDWSYLAAGAYSLQQWNKVLDGAIPYTSKPLVKQVASWASLYKAGCTSTNVTTQDSDNVFMSGKVAMVMNYSGLYPTYVKALGNKLGAMLPPWSQTPQHAMIELPGAGYSVAKASPNAKLAAEFVAYTVSRASQRLVAKDGQLPVIKGMSVAGATNALLTWAHSGKYTLYPMFDNFMQPEVVAELNSQLPQAFIGHLSAKAALMTMQQALTSLPASERQVQYHLGGS